MKRIFPLIIAAALTLSACSGTDGDASNVQAASAEPSSQSEPGGENQSAPADVKTVYGEVSEVIGNIIIVKTIEIPERGEFGARGEIPLGEDGQPDLSQIQRPERSTEGEGESEGFTPGEMPEGFTPGEMPEGFTPGAGRQNAEGGTPGEPNYTGEEVELILPVGITINSSTVGTDGVETTEIQLTAIKAGDMITVVYKEDGKTVDTVTISQAGTAGGGMMGQGDGGFFFGGDMGGMGAPPMGF